MLEGSGAKGLLTSRCRLKRLFDPGCTAVTACCLLGFGGLLHGDGVLPRDFGRLKRSMPRRQSHEESSQQSGVRSPVMQGDPRKA